MEPLAATYYNTEEKTWYGPRRKDLYSEDTTLGDVIYDVLKRNPNKIIQIHDETGEKLTCSELLQYAEALSRNFLRMGLQKGDVIGLYANNWTHVVTIMLASFLCGIPVNSLYPAYDKESAFLIYKVTKPKIIFCEMANYENAQSLAKDLNLENPVYVLDGELEGVPNIKNLLTYKFENKEDENFSYACLDLKGDDTALISCSSGTTGFPKPVLLSHRTLLNRKSFLTLNNESVLFTFSTMFWGSGPWNLISSLIHGSLRIVTTRTYKPEYFLYLLKQYKITHLLMTATSMAELCTSKTLTPEEIQEAFESVVTLKSGGAIVCLTIQQKINSIMSNIKNRPGFAVVYGMTELSGMISINAAGFMERLEGSEGKLVSNCQVRILSKEGYRLGPLERGEICIYTPYKWSGYLNNPEATEKAIRNGWLYTGDIGYFDEQGYLHVCGRDNDVFKSQCFQIYPPLIEDVVQRLAGIAECCVFGIPDFVAINLIACAVKRTNDEDGSKITAEKVDEHVQNSMGPNYHLTGGVYILDSIPKTGSGKVQRNKVLEIILDKKKKLNGYRDTNLTSENGQIKSK